MLAYLFTPIVCLSKQSWHSSVITSHHFHVVFPRNTWLGTDIFIKGEYIVRSLVNIKSIPDWHLFISRMEKKWTKWYAMTSHVIAYRSLELLFGTHTFHFNCFFDDFYCVFTQIRCLSRMLTLISKYCTELQISFWVIWVFKLFPIAYLQKQLRFFFTPHFLWLHIMPAMFSYWMSPWGAYLHIYSSLPF